MNKIFIQLILCLLALPPLQAKQTPEIDKVFKLYKEIRKTKLSLDPKEVDIINIRKKIDKIEEKLRIKSLVDTFYNYGEFSESHMIIFETYFVNKPHSGYTVPRYPYRDAIAKIHYHSINRDGNDKISYTSALSDVLRIVSDEKFAFENKFHVLYGISSTLGRQRTWQLVNDDMVMRIVVTPKTSVIIALFPVNKFNSGLAAIDVKENSQLKYSRAPSNLNSNWAFIIRRTGLTQ